MATMRGIASDDDGPVGPSREDIETLCLLYAVGSAGRTAGDVARRLGLPVTLAGAVAEAAGSMVEEGWVEDRAGTFILTGEGRSFLGRRLAEWGISSGQAGGVGTIMNGVAYFYTT